MLHDTITKVISGQGGGRTLKAALLCTSWAYKVGLKTKQTLDSVLWYKSPKVNAVVVCIGNIIAGGSGKTPFLQRLMTDLKKIPRESVAVVSRGYKGQYSKTKDVLHLNHEPYLKPRECGDEAYMMYKKFPESLFFVSKNRFLGANRAVCRGASLILLDDGMQNTTLFHNLKVVVLHADKLLGGLGLEEGFFLPRGALRDFPSSLKKADYIVVNHVRDDKHIEKIEARLKNFVTCPIIYTRMKSQGYFDEKGKVDLEEGARVGVFCGVGSPETFLQSVKDTGLDIATSLCLSDHEKPSQEVLEKFIMRAKTRGCKGLVCSEKDWVKLIKKEGYALPLCYVKSELDVVKGVNGYSELLVNIEELVRERENI